MQIISIVGDITSDTYAAFSAQMTDIESKGPKQHIIVEINSKGGDTYDALAIAARIRMSRCVVTTRAMGACMSAATIILAAGSLRSMSKTCWWMLHSAKDKWSGTPGDVEKEVKQLKKEETQWIYLLEEYTGVPAALYADLSADSSYLTAEQCLELNIIDKII
jgi:ATP-dependent Clp protease, protease subunit